MNAARRSIVAITTLLVLVVVGLAGVFAAGASAGTLVRPQNAVAPIAVHGGQVVGAHQPVLAGQGRARAPSYDRMAVGSSVAAEGGGGDAQTLFHYTNEAGQKGILENGELNPSLKSVNPNDVRYGNGQYLSDIEPGTKTGAQLSRTFLGQPFQGARFTHFVEINVSDLNVVQGRPGVFVIPGETPLDLTGRIVSSGING